MAGVEGVHAESPGDFAAALLQCELRQWSDAKFFRRHFEGADVEMCLLKIRSRQRRRIIASLGQRPRMREIETPTALKARFTVDKKLDSPTLIEPRANAPG